MGSRRAHRTHGRRTVAWGDIVRGMPLAAASLLLVVTAVLATAAPASAHADLASTDPASGVTLAALPAEITLTFTEAPLPRAGLTIVRVTDAAGRSLAQGDPRVEGVVVTQRLAGPAAGPIEVAFKVVTDDGHATTGEYAFTVAGVAPVATPTPTATPAATSSAPAAVEQSAVPTWDATGTPAASGVSDIAPLLALLTVLFAALVAAVVVLLRALRRSARSAPDSDR